MLKLPAICLDKIQLLPGTVLRLVLSEGPLLRAVDTALSGPDHRLAVFARRVAGGSEPGPADLFAIGMQALVEQEPAENGKFCALVRGLERVHLVDLQGGVAEVEALPSLAEGGEGLEALRLELLSMSQRLGLLIGKTLPVATVWANLSPLTLAYQVAVAFDFPLARLQPLLEAPTAEDALRLVLDHVSRDHRIQKLRQKLDREARAELGQAEHRAFLQEELRSIRRELGDDDEQAEVEALRTRLEAAELGPDVRREAERQLKTLGRLPRSASDYAPTLTHLELLLDLPWQKLTVDRHDLPRARALLEARHHALEEVKTRILEHLAVMKLNPRARSPILCFLGPPGTGKTSLGRQIAEALGRSFEHISLGGMHDEAELRGHRRTYVAALPGRILTALRRAGSRNPVVMLDEIDKLGRAGHEGDPAAALMEILDPSENTAFHDNYLDLPFDLSAVFFITTANTLEGVPRPLLDRLEVIPFEGYTLLEKLEIARLYLLPHQLEEAGLTPDQVVVPDESLRALIQGYTREAGLRQLERTLAKLARQLALRVAEGGETGPFRIEGAFLRELLGRELHRPESARVQPPAGVAAGLSWSESGGDVLYVEAALVPEGAGLTLTGQLGEVMRESGQTAWSLVCSRARELGIGRQVLRRSPHVHVPAGAVRKDGPSAGAALVVALASACTRRPARPDTAMTGEITLAGLILPVGGLKAKLLAAQRAGLRRVILPADNRLEAEELPAEVTGQLELLFVHDVDGLLAAAL